MKHVTTFPEGFLFIDKPTGVSSYDVIRHLKKFLPRGVTIGHGGTLDPLASGLIIVGIGRSATRRFSHFLHTSKEYLVSAELGVSTDTYDTEGTVTATCDARSITQDQLLKSLSLFVGEHDQTPPMYSALKHKGKKLYEIARKGKTVERKSRRINISRITLQSFKNPYVQFTVRCSGGTYIRSLVDDIGKRLEVGAVMTGLRRVQIEDYSIDSALPLDVIVFSEIIVDNLRKL